MAAHWRSAERRVDLYDGGGGVPRGTGIGRGLGTMQRNSQVKSTTGPQSKAPAAMLMVLRPDTTGETKKWKVIVVLPFVTTTDSAAAPLILKSLAWTVNGSTGSLTFTTKSLGRVEMVIPHEALVTVQGVAVTAARASRNAMMTMIDVVVRVIFTFYYHFVIAV